MFSGSSVSFFEILRVFVSLSFLLVSSWYDFKTREVPNRVWVLFAPIGLALAILQASLNLLAGENVDLFIWLISFAVTTGISLGLFYVGLFGGADAKALICLSLSLPVYPSSIDYDLNVLTPLFPLAVFSNAVLGSSSLVLVIVSYNLVELVQSGGRLFDGLKGEPLWSKIIAFATGFKVDPDKLRAGSHYIPLEYMCRGKDGEIVRHLRVSPLLLEEDSQENNRLDHVSEEVVGKVWATPGLPFLVFVTVGFVVALLYGDFVTWLIVRLIDAGII